MAEYVRAEPRLTVIDVRVSRKVVAVPLSTRPCTSARTTPSACGHSSWGRCRRRRRAARLRLHLDARLSVMDDHRVLFTVPSAIAVPVPIAVPVLGKRRCAQQRRGGGKR